MEVYADWYFDLGKTENGSTKYDHLRQVERQTGRTPRGLKGPSFPHLVGHVWSAFLVLSKCRSQSQAGPQRIGFEQIKAWKELTGNHLSTRDVEALLRLDTIYMRASNG